MTLTVHVKNQMHLNALHQNYRAMSSFWDILIRAECTSPHHSRMNVTQLTAIYSFYSTEL